MGATTMEKISSLLKKLSSSSSEDERADSFIFEQGEEFAWDHRVRRIMYNPNEPNAQMYLLHEFGHAMLDHQGYVRDINLLQIEREAWDYAQNYSKKIGITISDEIVDDSLDSYRDWLHSRSLCPSCGTTGVQQDNLSYRCPACTQQWHSNEARTCALRRYTL